MKDLTDRKGGNNAADNSYTKKKSCITAAFL